MSRSAAATSAIRTARRFLSSLRRGSLWVTVDVTVTTGGGSTTDPSAFTYVLPPVVSGLSVPSGLTPASGALEGGTPVTITGTDLAGATEVDFGPNNPATIVSETDSQITVTSPASYTGTVGTVDVTVTTPTNGTSNISPPADQFTYTNAPFITQITGSVSLNGNQPAGFVAGGTP